MKTEVKAAAIKVSKKDLEMIPTIGGEPDIAQYMQIIPGVVFTGDQGGQLYIRGGSPVQNKVLLDGMIIYSPFHSIGLFSVFDSDIIKSTDVYEIRKYADRLAVEVVSTTGDNSFRKLFNYISGKNKKNQEIKMTIPVTQTEKSGNMTMQFYLPSKFNKDNVPDPTNSDVEVINIEGGYYAVIRYSGRASEENFIKHKSILEDQLIKDNIQIRGFHDTGL